MIILSIELETMGKSMGWDCKDPYMTGYYTNTSRPIYIHHLQKTKKIVLPQSITGVLGVTNMWMTKYVSD